MNKLIDIVHQNRTENWSTKNQDAFYELFGSDGGRYSERAKKEVTLRAPEFRGDSGVPFSAYIHPSNPDSGAYGGMSFVIFPVPNAPCLIGMVTGTQGLSPDEEVLGRPGHARKVAAICQWLNRKYGKGKMVAWAKEDPVRTDLNVPENIKASFSDYSTVLNRYGKEIYGFYAPNSDKNATTDALVAFLDLMFEERGQYPLKSSSEGAEQVRAQYFSYLMPDVTEDELESLLRERRFVILQGPPGTGKTRMALRILEKVYKNNGFSIQFHPNTTYENFVGGLAPVQTKDALGLGFAPKKGFLMQATELAIQNTTKQFLIHIDEINRADLSKVLGEAIFLLESNVEHKREIDLSFDFGAPFYKKFSLPENLHILGTMNSADRSIAIVDVAVRRRFAFVKLWPQMSVVQSKSGPLMQEAYIRLISIFVEHAGEDALALVPGHSYFLEKDDTKAARNLAVNLAPLLEEYLEQGYVASFANNIRAYLQWIEGIQG